MRMMKKTKNEKDAPIAAIKISVGNSDCDKIMIEMLKSSSSISILEESDKELLVCPVESQKLVKTNPMKVEVIKVIPTNKSRPPIFDSLFRPKRRKQPRYDFSKIISISGLLLNK